MVVRGENLESKQTSHCFHDVLSGNSPYSPYALAKHYQVVEKNPKAAILWFWKAINAGDRVDNALKDMVVAMKQTCRTEETIEAIKSFRDLCSEQSQEQLDNLLIHLYKKCGRIDDQIQLYKQKLCSIYRGEMFNGRTIKSSRSHGKKIQVSIQQEMARILGNLGWAYMQQEKYEAAEVVYRKAQQLNWNANVACSLGYCLMKMGILEEAFRVLDDVVSWRFFGELGSEMRRQSVNRAAEVMRELEELRMEFDAVSSLDIEEEIVERLELIMSE